MLNNILIFTPRGMEFEPDQMHAEMAVLETGLSHANPVTTPWDHEADKRTSDDDADYLNAELGAKYRSVAARLNYLAPDRPDIQYATKELCRTMAAPRVGDWSRLKRVVRYLLGRPRLVTKYEYQDTVQELSVYSDSNWAGCRVTRKSTSGGCLCLGNHCIKSWSKTQHNIATSSAETKAIAVVKATLERVIVSRMCSEFGTALVTST